MWNQNLRNIDCVRFLYARDWIKETIADNDHTNNMVNFLVFFTNLWRPLIFLSWTSDDFCPGFQIQGGSPNLPASLSLWHLVTSWQQHGSWAVSSMYLCPSIGGSRVQDQARTWWSLTGVYFSILSICILNVFFNCVLHIQIKGNLHEIGMKFVKSLQGVFIVQKRPL